MRSFLVGAAMLLFPFVASAQPNEIDRQEILQALEDMPTERMAAPAWCYRGWYVEDCFTADMFVRLLLEIARAQNEAERSNEAALAAHFRRAFEEAREKGIRGWCEARRQDAFDRGSTTALRCSPQNTVFVVYYDRLEENETQPTTHIHTVKTRIEEAWGVIRDLQMSIRNCRPRRIEDFRECPRRLRVTRMVYTQQNPLLRISVE